MIKNKEEIRAKRFLTKLIFFLSLIVLYSCGKSSDESMEIRFQSIGLISGYTGFSDFNGREQNQITAIFKDLKEKDPMKDGIEKVDPFVLLLGDKKMEIDIQALFKESEDKKVSIRFFEGRSQKEYYLDYGDLLCDKLRDLIDGVLRRNELTSENMLKAMENNWTIPVE